MARTAAHDSSSNECILSLAHAAAALAVGSAFFALWFWLLPGWLGFQVDTAGTPRWRWLAAISSIFGFAVALRCVWDFGWTGHGTPAPMIPPQRLVVYLGCPNLRDFRRLGITDSRVHKSLTCSPSGSIRPLRKLFQIVHESRHSVSKVFVPSHSSKCSADRFDQCPQSKVGLRVQNRKVQLRFIGRHLVRIHNRCAKTNLVDKICSPGVSTG